MSSAMGFLKQHLLGFASVAALCLPTGVSAQEAADESDEIVVTAQFRSERLQDVPATVRAIQGDQLTGLGVLGTRQLTQVVPNLVFARGNTSQAPYLRGVGTRNAGIGDESSVAVYIDGVYQPANSALDLDFLGVDRIEVLSGPQGTLYGRNATGGLINVITLDPEQEFSGQLEASYGRFGERSVRAYTTFGLTPTLAASISGGLYRDDGYLTDVVTGEDAGARSTDYLRGKLLYRPSGAFEAVLTASYQHTDDPAAQLNQPFMLNSQAFAAPPFPAAVADDPYETAVERDLRSFTRTASYDLRTSWDLGEVILETTSSYQRNRSRVDVDNDATTEPIQFLIVIPESEYVTNEFRLLSDNASPFSWILGGFVIDGEGRYDGNQTYANDVLIATTYTRQETTAWAVFADGTWNITDDLRLIAGVRYTAEERSFSAHSPTAVLVPEREADWENVSFRGIVQYDLNDDANVYFSFNRGFKSGVFNGFASSPSAAEPVDPETLDAFEVGLRAQPTRWLTSNLSVFHYDYSDVQFSAKGVTGLVVLTNAASATVDGAEIDLTFRPTDNLSVRLFATYLDARYDEFPNAPAFLPTGLGGNFDPGPVDVSGNDMIRSPRHTVGLIVDYERPTEFGTFGVAANIKYMDEYSWVPTDRLMQPSFTMVNGELSWRPPGHDNVRVSLWGRNLADEIVYNQMLESRFADLVSYERPRSYGVAVAYEW